MTKQDFSLSGRTALITGAGQGVGAAIAGLLAAHGAHVLVNDVRSARAEEVAARIAEEGGSAEALPFDVTDHAAVTASLGKHPQLSIVVNNAGNAGADPTADARKPFWETGPDIWRQWIDVNLMGVMNVCSAAIPNMIGGGGGRIVTIISDAGRVGEAGMEPYSAAKAGAAGLTRAMARSLGRHGITANAISIAATETPATAARLADPELVRKVFAGYVVRRPGQPSEIAAMALLLASDASAWITGQTYPVNGGFSFAQ